MTRMFPAIAFATSNALANVPLAEVEKGYWDCDYAVNQGRLDFGDAEYCSKLYERLKKEKFNSDFDQFLRWWKANKERENVARANAWSPRR